MSYELKDRLRELMALRKMSAKDLAERVPCTRQAVYLWLNGQAQPTDKLPGIASALGVTVETLTNASQFVIDGSQPVIAYVPGEEQPPAGFVEIPEYQLVCHGGDDSYEPTWEELHETKAACYPLEFFQERHTTPQKCRRIKVEGDSMSPLICEGDRVLIEDEQDKKNPHIIDGKIYVFANDGQGLRVKRLSRKVDGTLIVRSDNPSYPTEEIPPENQEYLYVLGRVLQIIRNLS